MPRAYIIDAEALDVASASRAGSGRCSAEFPGFREIAVTGITAPLNPCTNKGSAGDSREKARKIAAVTESVGITAIYPDSVNSDEFWKLPSLVSLPRSILVPTSLGKVTAAAAASEIRCLPTSAVMAVTAVTPVFRSSGKFCYNAHFYPPRFHAVISAVNSTHFLA